VKETAQLALIIIAEKHKADELRGELEKYLQFFRQEDVQADLRNGK